MPHPNIKLAECCATCKHAERIIDRKVCCLFYYGNNDEGSQYYPPMYAVCDNYQYLHKGMMIGELRRSIEKLARWLKINVADLTNLFN